MYMLNLVFKIDPNAPYGQFSGDVSGAYLEKSRDWLRLKVDDPDDISKFDPEDTKKWNPLGEAGTLLIPKRKDSSGKAKVDWICIRVLRHPGSDPNAAIQKVQLVVSFGRPVRATQDYASPFTHDDSDTGRAVTAFVLDGQGAGPAWFFPLKKIARWSTEENLTHRYEFSVGLIVKTSAGEYHYGEDPEMDIAL